MLVPDAQADERFRKRFDELFDFTTRSLICLPMKNRGKVLGVIELVNRIEETTSSDLDMRALERLTEHGAIAIQNAAMINRIRRLVITDDHTSLYNARYLYEGLDRELSAAHRDGHEVSMIFFDPDHFKQVNDAHGHVSRQGIEPGRHRVCMIPGPEAGLPPRHGRGHGIGFEVRYMERVFVPSRDFTQETRGGLENGLVFDQIE